MQQPHCFVIAHLTSRVVSDCVTSLQLHGWNFSVVAAVDGWQIKHSDWSSIGIKMSDQGKMPQRPGAQGCWFSHYKLWQQAVQTNTSMVIMEHDAVVQEPWPQDIDTESALLKLYTTADCKEKVDTGVFSKGSHAYTLTPDQAKQLIHSAKTRGAVAVDKQIASKVCAWKFYHRDVVVLNPNRGRSTTSPKRL